MKVIPKDRRLHCKKCVKMQAQFVRSIHDKKLKYTSEQFADYKDWVSRQNLLLFEKGLTPSFLLKMVDLFEEDLEEMLKQLRRNLRQYVIRHSNQQNN